MSMILLSMILLQDESLVLNQPHVNDSAAGARAATRKDGAPGVDGQDGRDYAEGLLDRLEDLLSRADRCTKSSV